MTPTVRWIARTVPAGSPRVEWQRGGGGWRVVASVPDGVTAHLRVAGHERQLAAGEHVVHVPAGDPVSR